MAQKGSHEVNPEETKTEEISPPIVNDLNNKLPQTKFEINYKDKNELIKDVHYVSNHLFPLNNQQYQKDTDISKSSYKLSVIKGGITNLLYLMTPNDDIKKDEKESCKKLLVRVYGENTEVLIDRDREEKLFHELGNLGFGPKLYGLFGNGRMEEWYDNAHTLKLDERKHYKKVCGTLAEMHSIHPVLLENEKTESLLWKIIDKWYNIASNVEFKENNDKQQKYEQLNWKNISLQIDKMKSFMIPNNNNNNNNNIKQMITKQFENKKVNMMAFDFMFDIVFSHNDLLGGNILYLQDTQQIKFVDFEYGAYNYRAFDFANHFCEYAGFDCDWKQHFPQKNHIKQFVNDYIECLCHNKQYKQNINENIINIYKKENNFTDHDYNDFLNICSDIIIIFTCSDHYFWGLWGVVQSRHSPIDFDFIQYANDRLISGYQYSLTLLPNYLKFVD